MAIEEDLSQWEIAPLRKMIAYGFGYVVINYLLGYGLANLFYFYEVEVGLPVIYVGIAFIIFAIWNMINDPLLGYLTEKPSTRIQKYGLRAPWVVGTSIPVLIFFWLVWVPPQGASAIVIFLWFIILTCVFDTFFSIYNDHIYGGYTNQFPSEYERRRSFAIITIMMFIIITAMSVIGSLTIEYGNIESFVTWATMMVILMAIFNVFLFTGIGESEEMKKMFITSFEKAKDVNFFQTMKTALKTKNFAVSLLGYTISITATSLFTASLIYLFKDVYRLPYSASALPSIIGVIVALAFIPFWSNYARKHGFKKTYWVSYVIMGICFIPFFFSTNIITHIIFYCIYNAFYIGSVTMLMPVASDTYDEVSSRMEKRVDATLVGVRTFFFRVAFLVQAIVITLVHISTGYNPDPSPYILQSQAAIIGIRIHTAIIPGVMMIVMGLIFAKYYTLEGAYKEDLVKKLKDIGIYR
jgi:GPH family glycoside/pentoside/hexuronide:cation symporter